MQNLKINKVKPMNSFTFEFIPNNNCKEFHNNIDDCIENERYSATIATVPIRYIKIMYNQVQVTWLYIIHSNILGWCKCRQLPTEVTIHIDSFDVKSHKYWLLMIWSCDKCECDNTSWIY